MTTKGTKKGGAPCGHSACGQNYIDTGSRECIAERYEILEENVSFRIYRIRAASVEDAIAIYEGGDVEQDYEQGDDESTGRIIVDGVSYERGANGWEIDEPATINGPDAVDFVAQRLEHFGLYIDADAHAPCLVCGVPSDESGVCREEGCPGNPATD